jgi:hypothetical protein
MIPEDSRSFTSDRRAQYRRRAIKRWTQPANTIVLRDPKQHALAQKAPAEQNRNLYQGQCQLARGQTIPQAWRKMMQAGTLRMHEVAKRSMNPITCPGRIQAEFQSCGRVEMPWDLSTGILIRLEACEGHRSRGRHVERPSVV